MYRLSYHRKLLNTPATTVKASAVRSLLLCPSAIPAIRVRTFNYILRGINFWRAFKIMLPEMYRHRNRVERLKNDGYLWFQYIRDQECRWRCWEDSSEMLACFATGVGAKPILRPVLNILFGASSGYQCRPKESGSSCPIDLKTLAACSGNLNQIPPFQSTVLTSRSDRTDTTYKDHWQYYSTLLVNNTAIGCFASRKLDHFAVGEAEYYCSGKGRTKAIVKGQDNSNHPIIEPTSML